MSSPPPLAPLARQQGVALITSLIFLVMLTIIGVTAARMSSMEERMAGNMRDRDIALRAAEMGLRDAERDVMNAVPAYARNISGCSGFVANCGASTVTDVDDGRCYNGPSGYGTPIWQAADWMGTPTGTQPRTVPYGRFTHATAIAGVSAQPRYLIECLPKTDGTYYRIIVRAQGAKPGTAVMLEEIVTSGE
jgi:type IV pilus assembly protein PilX